MTGNRLYKYEKLCSRTAISNIFKDGESAISYPLRGAFSIVEAERTPAQFLITIPKKKIRHAVDRVLLRRRIREAYRLNRNVLLPTLENSGKSVKIAFIYLDTNIRTYAQIESKMKLLLGKIAAAVEAKSQKSEHLADTNQAQ